MDEFYAQVCAQNVLRAPDENVPCSCSLYEDLVLAVSHTDSPPFVVNVIREAQSLYVVDRQS
jgi:hypothetical protein